MPMPQRSTPWFCFVLALVAAGLMGPALAPADHHEADPPAEDNRWVALIPEEGLAGWAAGNEAEAAHWKNESGQIVGENADQRGSILWTESRFTDFEIELAYMTPSQDYDSGVFLRGESHQVQIGISRSLQKDMTACIYAPADKRGGYPGQSDKVADVHQEGEWNTLRIVVTGKRIQTFLNGEPMVDYEGVEIPDRGPIGLQLHAGVHMQIRFRDLRVRELDADADDE